MNTTTPDATPRRVSARRGIGFLCGTLFFVSAQAARAETPEPGAVAVSRLSEVGTQTFFGYYDVPPVDPKTGRHLAHRVPFRDRLPEAADEAELGYFTLDGDSTFTPFARTKAWNFQQGSMLQWVGDGSGRVFYNEVAPDGNGYRGVLMNLETKARTYTDRALFDLSDDGRWGLAVDFDRLHDFRPGYGYATRPDPRADIKHPADDGLWVCDLQTGQSKLVLSLAALHEHVAKLSPAMGEKLLINHVTFNPSGTRFVLLLRNFPEGADINPGGTPWKTTVLTAARDGSDLRVIIPPGRASHYHWRDDHTLTFYGILAGKRGLYEITDEKEPAITAIDPTFFLLDGHCSYSTDRRWMLFDSYPGRLARQHLYLYDLEEKRGHVLGVFPALPVPVADLRCDLHPRWLPDGRISFDSTHEGYRGIYIADPRTLTRAP